jgi:Fic family protein
MDDTISLSVSLDLERELKSLYGEVIGIANVINSLDLDAKAYLHRCATISTIGASTRIENAVLTDAEVEWVDTVLAKSGKTTAFAETKTFIFDKLSKDRERSIEEVVGCREILSLIYLQGEALYPLTETTLRGLHEVLLSYYPQAVGYAGGYKTTPNRVVSVNHDTGEQKIVLEPALPGVITETAMRDLLEWYNGIIKRHPWAILVATEFVFRFLAIHPFQDGNGRLGRALFLMALLQSDDPALRLIVQYVSIDRQIERHRPLYYSTLQQASGGFYRADAKDYNLEPLVWFFLKMIRLSLGDVSFLITRYSALRSLSESALKVLDCFKSSPEKRLKVAEIVLETGLVRRTVQNALIRLVDGRFISRLGEGAGTRYQLIF